MLIGYARIATAGESFDLDLQKKALEQAGVDWLFVDMVDADAVKRPQLEQALLQLRRGDTLVVWRLDRIGRSLLHLIETIEDLDRRGFGFRSLDDNINTMTAAGKLMFPAFEALAKFQRDIIQQQTGTRQVKAQPRRRRRGPQPKLDETKQSLAVTLHHDPSNSIDDICERLQIGQRTLYRYVGKEGGRKTARKPKVNTADGLSTPRGE